MDRDLECPYCEHGWAHHSSTEPDLGCVAVITNTTSNFRVEDFCDCKHRKDEPHAKETSHEE